MGEPRGFLKYERQSARHRGIEERIKDFKDLNLPLTPDEIKQQAARCMDCGVPFCHGAGCPLENRIPEFNELVYMGRWKEACDNLHSTSNFPEVTGRICPALCEASCTLAINDEAVSVRQIELQIVERGWEEGWIKPLPANTRTGKNVAVIGSGPAGLAVAQQLARVGHDVTVFEKDEKAGGLLRYGIPDFKLEKQIIDRRLGQLSEEGVQFQTGVTVGDDISVRYLRKMFDCVCLTMGAGQPRDLSVPGRDYENVVFAWDYLAMQNKLCSGEPVGSDKLINAKGKSVVVIGGGDTGSDCVGTARRQGAKAIYQLEILPQPPEACPSDTPWPLWPRIMRTSTSQEEGCERRWGVMTKHLMGVETRVSELHGCEVKWFKKDGDWKLEEVPGSDFVLKADLVLLAMGFVHVQHEGLVREFGLRLDERGNILVNNYQTSDPSVFAAGDSVSGASLVVRAVKQGREAAIEIDKYLRQN